MCTPQDFRRVSQQVLNYKDTIWQQNKNCIQNIFKQKKVRAGDVETVRGRLAFINTLYSTNIAKYPGAFEQMSQFLAKFSDRELKKKFLSVLQDNQSEDENTVNAMQLKCEEIFDEPFGNPKCHPVSLISKYAYYLCAFEFPIYDSLVRKNIIIFMQYFFPKNPYSKKPPTQNKLKKIFEYLKILKTFQEKSHLSYADIDAMIWLYGKCQKKSVTSFLTSEEQETLVQGEFSQTWKTFQNSIKKTKSLKKHLASLCDFLKQVIVHRNKNNRSSNLKRVKTVR